MASFTITLPDAQAPRLVAAVAKIRGVDITAMNLAQKVAFLKADLRDYWIDLMTQTELPAVVDVAASAAKATKLAEISSNLTIT